MVDNNTINIVISDETKGNRFSTGVTQGEGAANAALTPITGQQGGGTGAGASVARAVGMRVANQATGGAIGMITIAATPVGMAMLALTVATKAYTAWQENKKQERERANIMMRAGGSLRSDNVNLYNARTNIITGKIQGTTTIYGRR